ncbi:hypothetical protein QCM77_15170 [Bradyrhizobium sp. SSUT18]|uniref:hypothetical protein n=1 Tax=unclassified Bradyrhizobium TaxID=2631580 RepID=UPI0024477AD4|nr:MULTISPECIES: hypothetical protein [unclassified Bradyrhizobium]MDH2346018.1 hypothetical protein [Bradyrhizobium sp. SSUT77]MDH2401282.1 hypothetical protein [Bradyrhizobium sp. SSUT18]
MMSRSRNLLIHGHRDDDRRCAASIILQRGICEDSAHRSRIDGTRGLEFTRIR